MMRQPDQLWPRPWPPSESEAAIIEATAHPDACSASIEAD
jgi:hypothetical protein